MEESGIEDRSPACQADARKARGGPEPARKPPMPPEGGGHPRKRRSPGSRTAAGPSKALHKPAPAVTVTPFRNAPVGQRYVGTGRYGGALRVGHLHYSVCDACTTGAAVTGCVAVTGLTGRGAAGAAGLMWNSSRLGSLWTLPSLASLPSKPNASPPG
jgi:hypothetical protein